MKNAIPGWDIAETRRLIEYHHGREQLDLAKPSLRSVNERLRHARYHFQEAKRLLKTHIDDRFEGEDVFKLMFPEGLEEWNALDEWFMKVEANMIACAQSIHSIPDTLAHVIHFALGLNRGDKPQRERDVNARSVATALAARAPAYLEVEHTFRAIKDNLSFAMLNAVVNHTKHRGAIKPQLSLMPSDRPAPYAMEFGPFAYDNVKYPQRELEEVLAPSYEAASHVIVATGNAINSVLSR